MGVRIVNAGDAVLYIDTSVVKELYMQFRDLHKQYEVLKEDIDRSITSVVSSAHFISGSQVAELEEKLAEYVGIRHCISCANGTDALTIALMAWGVGAGLYVLFFGGVSGGRRRNADFCGC